MSLPSNFKETNQVKQEIKCRWCHDTRLYQPLVGDATECLECKPVSTTGFKAAQDTMLCFISEGKPPCGTVLCTRSAGHTGKHAEHGFIPSLPPGDLTRYPVKKSWD